MMMDGDSEGATWLLKKYGGKVKATLRCEFHQVLADPEINEALNIATLNAFRAAHQYDESKGQTWPRHPCHLWGRKTTGLARGADDMCRQSYTPRLLSWLTF